MSNSSKEIYKVNAFSDPVVVKVIGRASYTNTAPFNEFLNCVFDKGKHNILIDFKECTGMDSTFLGILAGASLEVQSARPAGKVTLCRLNGRNLELVRNLGLDRIAEISESSTSCGDVPVPDEGLKEIEQSEMDSARMILKAHQNLVEVDESNEAKFQDVISFLKNQVEES